MKVLISCTVLDELELYIDEKVILDEKKIPSVRRAVRPPSAVSQQIFST
jgi:hypothetical protein